MSFVTTLSKVRLFIAIFSYPFVTILINVRISYSERFVQICSSPLCNAREGLQGNKILKKIEPNIHGSHPTGFLKRREAIRTEVEDMLEDDMIQPLKSTLSAPIIVVNNWDSTLTLFIWIPTDGQNHEKRTCTHEPTMPLTNFAFFAIRFTIKMLVVVVYLVQKKRLK